MPSGDPSSTIMSSQSRLLERNEGRRRAAFGSVLLYFRRRCIHGIYDSAIEEKRRNYIRRILLAKGAVEEPGDDRQVAALVVGRKDNRVFIALGRHCICYSVSVFKINRSNEQRNFIK